jgi:DNA-binding CsgD family transcriptional regulator
MLAGRSAECVRLDQLLLEARSGKSAVLVVRGEPGVGKTALLDYTAHRALGFRIIHVVGVESEMELPYAGLQVLCASLVDRLDRLPSPQRGALGTAFGLSQGPPPDRFLVGLATLSLLADAADEVPLVCIVDDAQWLDRSSAQAVAFVARRIEVEPIAFLFAETDADALRELAAFPQLPLEGLPYTEARDLLDSVITGPLDDSIRARIVAETHGNPLALLEIARRVSSDGLAGGFGVIPAFQLSNRIDVSFSEQVECLPDESRQLLLAAAAEPVGDPTLLWRAAAELGIPIEAAEPLKSSGLLSIGSMVAFRHPLLRSAIYRGASPSERRRVHRALAVATDPATDPDRRAWHRSCGAEGPDEEIVQELVRSAARAQSRGGLAAAAAFLEQATQLTLDSATRAERALAAAEVKYEAGLPEAALRLLVTAEMGPPEGAFRGRLERLRAQLGFALRRGNDAPILLLGVARRLEAFDPKSARETYLEALAAAIVAGRLSKGAGTREVAEAALRGPPLPHRGRPVGLLLESLGLRFTEGFAASFHPLTRAVEAFRDVDATDNAIHWLWLAYRVARDLWDDETWHDLTRLHVKLARDAGALTALPPALAYRAGVEVHSGDFAAAADLIEEANSISQATGCRPVDDSSLMLAGWRGREHAAVAMFEAARHDAENRGEGYLLTIADYSAAVLYNGLGRYEEALAAARDAAELDELGLRGWALVELIEAAARSDKPNVAALAFHRLSERTRLAATNWSLGVEARSRALIAPDPVAEKLYVEAIERLSRSRMKAHLARAHLVYGEWLRRQGRRIDARSPLLTAEELFATMGAEAFAARAHHELAASGERARRRSVHARDELTAQEVQVARLARDGLSNPEIGTRLYISRRTVEYHLHKVFAKLGISSRLELPEALADHEVSRARPIANLPAH